MTSTQTLIDHARHICVKEVNLYLHNESINPTSNIKKYIRL